MKISKVKKEKISEQILSLLYSSNLQPLFTSKISQEIARDEEFVKRLLLDLKKKGLLTEIKKNPKGIDYIKRSRWILSEKAYNAYKSHQNNNSTTINPSH